MSDIAFVYESVPPLPANISENKLFLLAVKLTPTLGCIIPYPSITTVFSLFNTGLFKICAIAPINSIPVFKTKSVSASNVIIYFIFGNKLSSLFSK